MVGRGDCSPVGCAAFILPKKLAVVREHLRHWAKFSFGSIKFRTLNLLQEVERFNILKETRRLSLQESQHEQMFLKQLGVIRK